MQAPEHKEKVIVDFNTNRKYTVSNQNREIMKNIASTTFVNSFKVHKNIIFIYIYIYIVIVWISGEEGPKIVEDLDREILRANRNWTPIL